MMCVIMKRTFVIVRGNYRGMKSEGFCCLNFGDIFSGDSKSRALPRNCFNLNMKEEIYSFINYFKWIGDELQGLQVTPN